MLCLYEYLAALRLQVSSGKVRAHILTLSAGKFAEATVYLISRHVFLLEVKSGQDVLLKSVFLFIFFFR